MTVCCWPCTMLQFTCSLIHVLCDQYCIRPVLYTVLDQGLYVAYVHLHTVQSTRPVNQFPLLRYDVRWQTQNMLTPWPWPTDLNVTVVMATCESVLKVDFVFITCSKPGMQLEMQIFSFLWWIFQWKFREIYVYFTMFFDVYTVWVKKK